MSKRVLTGITTTGIPHLGNYVGAIKPAIAASKSPDIESFLFMADYHALIKCQDPQKVHESTLAIAATWLACGLEPEKVYFYRQSDIPEIFELNWIITCCTAKGLMNRAHAYKAAVAENIERTKNTDPDKGVTMGLYCYPVLMAADILLFNAQQIPVGQDQLQHLEMARDIASRFNHHYGEHFNLPEPVITDNENATVLPGLDGRKMSKSYDNTIPLMAPEKKLEKLIKKIKTNSQPPEEPKDPESCNLFTLYQVFATKEETEQLRQRYHSGIGWGEVKKLLFEHLNKELNDYRKKYETLIAEPEKIEKILQQGAEKARKIATSRIEKIKKSVGIGPLK